MDAGVAIGCTLGAKEVPSYSSLTCPNKCRFRFQPIAAGPRVPQLRTEPARPLHHEPKVTFRLFPPLVSRVAYASLHLRQEPSDSGESSPTPDSTEQTFFRRGAFKLAGPLIRASHWSPPSSLIGYFLSNKDSPRCACALVLLLGGFFGRLKRD